MYILLIFFVVLLTLLFLFFIILSIYKIFFNKKNKIIKNSIFLSLDMQKNDYIKNVFFNYKLNVIIFKLSNISEEKIDVNQLKKMINSLAWKNKNYRDFENWEIRLIFKKAK